MRVMVLSLTLLAALPLIPTQLRADLTLKGTGSGSGLGVSTQGDNATYFKGGMMRGDWTSDGKTQTTILDLDHQKMIIIDPSKQKAEIYDLAKMAEKLKTIPDGDIKVEIKPTGKTRTILGRSCEEHLIKVFVPYKDPSGMSVDTTLSGPAWIAKDSPGLSDYRAFYLKAAEKGLFFNQPASVQAQPGRAKGMTRLYKELAKVGIAYDVAIEVTFHGSGMMAVMDKMGSIKSSGTVTSVSTEPLSDQIFAVPAGFKVKEK